MRTGCDSWQRGDMPAPVHSAGIRRGAKSLALLLFGLAVLPLWAADERLPARPPELVYGYPEQPPRAFTNSEGVADGHYPKLLRVLLARAGIPWRAVSYPAPRLMKNLQTGETNFSILVKNPLLDECCLYSRTNVWHDELRVYSVGNKPPIRKREDLAGKRIITIAGFSYGGLYTYLADPANQIQSNPAKTHHAAFEMLDAGRGDYLLDYAEAAVAEGLKKHPIENVRGDVLDVVQMYLVISKSYPDAAGVLKRLESIYESIRAEDTRRELTK